MRYWFEKYCPFLLSLLLTLALIIFKSHIKDVPALIDKISDNALGLSTTLVGFFLTIMTIINSIETRRMEFIRSRGLYPRLMKYLNESIKFNAVLIALSFVVKYVEHRSVIWLQLCGYNIVDYSYLFLLNLTLLLSLRFTNIFVSLLSDPKNSTGK